MAARVRRSLRGPLLSLLWTLAAAPAFAQCPLSDLPCGEPTTQTQITFLCPDPLGLGFTSGQGNHATGVFSVVAVDEGDGIDAFLRVRDRFFVEGLPAGTPFAIEARLAVSGVTASGCGPARDVPSGTIITQLLHGANQQSATASSSDAPPYPPQVCTYSGALNQTLVLTIPGVAGEGFDLSALFYSNASNGESSVGGTLSFAGLPAGSRVTSCKGFVQHSPVSAAASSWGRLKRIYR